ncbi:MAG TPA: LysR substrate-binding domain-containing protein [Gemmatimonadaceae bacterium]|nr:LysR substrate-binding domain-containing protein [Gemmatimonadaceae bacterium]
MALPDLRLLRYFVAVAEELHFGRAAGRLHVAQPGLSHQIKVLERLVGVRLLERTSRQVRLTPAGSLLLAESRRLLAEAERAIDRVRRTGRGEIGRLTVAAIGSATYDVVPRLLRAHRKRYPDVELVLREMSTPAQVHALRGGEIDVGLLRLPADTSDLVAHTVREDRMALMLPETHPLARKARIPLRALAREPLILFPAAPRPSWADTVIAACRESGFEPVVAQEAMESATVVSFVAAGVGVALVPEGLKVLARPGVAFRLLAPPAPVTRLAAVYRAGTLPPTVECFLGLVRELWPDGAPR